MNVIFDQINYTLYLFLKIFFFKKKFYYIKIDNSISDPLNFSNKLKDINIFPLPIDKLKNIKSSIFQENLIGNRESLYKQSLQLISNKELFYYSKLLELEDAKPKLRLIINDYLYSFNYSLNSRIQIWCSAKENEKKFFVFFSYSFSAWYFSFKKKNFYKIIIPLDIIRYFIYFFYILIKKIFSIKINLNFYKKKIFTKNSNSSKIAFVVNKGLFYGKLYRKSLYFLDNTKSYLNKKKLLFVNYDDLIYSNPKSLNWFNLKNQETNKFKLFFKVLLIMLRLVFFRNIKNIKGWLLIFRILYVYNKYLLLVKKINFIKIALIDYDILCPKLLILAFEKNNIITISTQERYSLSFYNNYSVVSDIYFTSSNFITKHLSKSKYYQVNHLITSGQYRCDWLNNFLKIKKKNKIISAKKNILILGYHSPKYWFESSVDPLLNFNAKKNFLIDIINLSKKYVDCNFILRFKDIDWFNNKEFYEYKKIFSNSKNLKLSTNYKNDRYTYFLCANSDLVISTPSSIADECIEVGVPVIIHNYTHNINKIFPNSCIYSKMEIMCNNYSQLDKKLYNFLFLRNNKNINKIKNKFYNSSIKNVKKFITSYVENELTKHE